MATVPKCLTSVKHVLKVNPTLRKQTKIFLKDGNLFSLNVASEKTIMVIATAIVMIDAVL